MPEEKLPYRVLAKSAEMFGGASGLSHREMSGFFLHELDKHPNEVGPTEGIIRVLTPSIVLPIRRP